MSIKLSIEPYCEDCSNFKPKALEETVTTASIGHGMEFVSCVKVVCQDRGRCKQIERHLRSYFKKEEEKQEIETDSKG